MGILLIILMVVFGAVAGYASLQANSGANWGKPAAGGSASIVLILAATSAVYTLGGCGDAAVESAQRSRAMQEMAYSFEGFGKAVGKQFNGSRALLVTVETTNKERLKMIEDAVTAGLGGNVEITKVWTPETPHAEAGELSFDAAKLDAAFDGSGADLVISLIGMPGDHEKLKLLSGSKAPKVAVMNATPDLKLKALIQGMKVQMAVLPNSSYKQADALPDADTYFASRYIVVEPKSLGQHGGLFR